MAKNEMKFVELVHSSHPTDTKQALGGLKLPGGELPYFPELDNDTRFPHTSAELICLP